METGNRKHNRSLDRNREMITFSSLVVASGRVLASSAALLKSSYALSDMAPSVSSLCHEELLGHR